jgi:hypothetical protein
VARLALVVVVAWGGSARAGGLVFDGSSGRAIGRAGVSTVADDGGDALIVNPAGLARRDTTRAQIGVVLADDSIDWHPSISDTPVARDQSASSALPMIAIETALDGWVFGIGAQTTAASARTFESPLDYPVDSLMNHFEYRYAGVASALRRDTASIGVARRLGDAVALGASFGMSRVALDEARSVWVDPVQGRAVDPNRDALVAISASGWSPSATAGVLIAPSDTRVELAASVAWAAASALTGDFSAAGPNMGMSAPGVAVDVESPNARLVLHEPVTVRTGARWVGERWIAEVDSDLWIYSSAAQAATWQLRGLTVTDPASGASTAISALPSRISAQTHGAVRAAVDVQLLAGFLWATAGYAYRTAGTSSARMSPTLGQLAGHTAAAGLEVTAGGFTIALGWSRTWSIARDAPNTVWLHDNPFGVGDSAVPTGRYDGSSDQIGIAVDAEL